MSNANQFFGGGGSYAPEINQLQSQVASSVNSNILINPEFRVNQRTWVDATPITGASGSILTRDRWKFSHDASGGSTVGATVNFPGTEHTTGVSTPAAEILGSFSGSPVGNEYMSFHQRVEDAAQFSGRAVTVSFEVMGSVDGVAGLRNTVVTNASPATVEGSVATYDVTTSWASKQITMTLPDLSTQPLGSDNYLDVQFDKIVGSILANSVGYTDPLNYTGTLSLRNIKVEFGSVATISVPRSIDEELAKCQRYYEEIRTRTTTVSYTTGVSRLDVTFSTPKRINVDTTSSATINLWRADGTSDNTSAGVISGSDNLDKDTRASLLLNNPTGVDNQVGYIDITIVADAEL